MATKPKFFCVAVEGETATDGRKIERSWITDIVATYNRATYGARINLEHIRGYTPDGPFKAYGDVLSVKSEEVTLSIGGKDEKRLGLFAELQPTDELVAMTKKNQKIYTSIEVAPNFGGSGKANLVGLAVTDSPASLGTDILEFSAKADDKAAAAVKAGFDSRKSKPEHLLTAAHEVTMTFDEEAAPSLKEQLTGFFTELLASGGKKEEPKTEVTPPAGDNAALMTAISGALEKGFVKVAEVTDAKFAALEANQTADRTAFNDLVAKLDLTPKDNTQRHRSSGGRDIELTDC